MELGPQFLRISFQLGLSQGLTCRACHCGAQVGERALPQAGPQAL